MNEEDIALRNLGFDSRTLDEEDSYKCLVIYRDLRTFIISFEVLISCTISSLLVFNS